MHRLFEEQVERTPTAPALAFGEERLDYAELNRRANRLAHALIERGVGADRLVGVAMERSIEMVVALMAILKAGGAYVPVDPEYPEERQAYMLEDSGVQLLQYPLQRGVHRLFEEQVERTPTAPALAFGEERLDYAELNRRANRLAHALIERGVGADRLVGVAMERSIEMVVALMAILKAGGAYVPVDPEYPEERQAYMLEDSGVQLLHEGGRTVTAAQPVRRGRLRRQLDHGKRRTPGFPGP